MAFLWRLALSLIDLINSWIEQTAQVGIQANGLVAGLIFCAVAAWIGPACWAAGIAESRNHLPKRHFFIGLLIPVIYPLVLLFGLKAKPKAKPEILQVSDQSQRKRIKFNAPEETPAAMAAAAAAAAADAAAAEVAAAAAPQPLATAAAGSGAAAEQQTAFNQQYFAELIEIEAAGPWLVRFDNIEIVVGKLLEALPKLIVVERLCDNGSSQRMRVLYAKIEAVEAQINALTTEK